MELNRAISDLAQIRAQLDRTESYRGFRSQTLGVSALLVFLASLVQQLSKVESVHSYLKIWFTIACASMVIACIEMAVRGAKSESEYVWKMHRRLILGMMPALISGGAVTLLIVLPVIGGVSPSDEFVYPPLVWALPGIWSINYSLGLFCCASNLTKHTKWIACYFLAAGLALLAFGAWYPEIFVWQMPLSFGIGQLIFALVLFWNTKNHHG